MVCRPAAAGISQESRLLQLHCCTVWWVQGQLGARQAQLLLTTLAHLAQHTGEALFWTGTQALVFHSRV